jgi:hypothetical protein
MKTQAWGWLMVGMMAAGLNAGYHHGAFQWAHRIAEDVTHNSGAVIALASGRADEFLAEARLLTVRDTQSPCARWAKAETAVEAKLDLPSHFADVDSDDVQSDELQNDDVQSDDVQNKDLPSSVREQVRQEVRRDFNHARTEIFQARTEARMAEHAARFQVTSSTFNSKMIRQISAQLRDMDLPACEHVRVVVPQIPAVKIPNVRVDAAAESF